MNLMRILCVLVIWGLTSTVQAKQLHFKNNFKSTVTDQVDTQNYILQFQDLATWEDRQAIEGLGAVVVSYVPEDAFIVRFLDPAAKNHIQEHFRGRVMQFVALAPSLKIDRELLSNKSQTFLNVVIRIFRNQDKNQFVTDLIHDSRVSVLHIDGKNLLVRMKAKHVMDIASRDEVEWMHEMPKFQTMYLDEKSKLKGLDGNYQDLDGFESGTKIMNFADAYALGLDGSGQVGSMADTGLDTGNLASLHTDFSNVTGGKGVALFSQGWQDPQGHGTHVAGSIVGTGAYSNGILAGGATGAQFYAQGMWSPLLNNIMFPFEMSTMFADAYSKGARVHSNSWGADQNGAYDNFAAQVDEYMFQNPKMLLVFAAGNSGKDNNRNGKIDEDSIGSPATGKNVLSVGASENFTSLGGIQRPLGELRDGDSKWGVPPLSTDLLSDNPNGIAGFSSRGPADDGRLKPDIVAPGTNILSLKSQFEGATELWGAYNDKYVWAGGTSMATPLTSAAALVARQFLVQKQNISDPSAALLKALLTNTAQDLAPGQYGTGQHQELQPRPDVHQGYGRVDVKAIVSSELLTIDANGIAQGEVQEYSFEKQAGRLVASMAYTDAPAAANAARTLVNNLDLIVRDPNGRVFNKNDSINNLEMIEIDGPAGVYTIQVRGTQIVNAPNGKLPYALVVR